MPRIALIAQPTSPDDPFGAACAPADTGGMTPLARALARLGQRVTVYTRRDSRTLPDGAALGPGVKLARLTAGPPTPLASDKLAPHIREFSEQLAAEWRRNPPDLVHAHSWPSGLAALAATHGMAVPVMQTFMSLGAAERRYHLAGSGRGALIRLEASIARSVAGVVARSTEETADLAQLGVPRKAVSMVPPGVDTTEFCPEGPAAPRGSRPRLLTVGSLAAHHGLGTAVQALAAIPDAELVIAGGPDKARLRQDKAYRDLLKLAKTLRVADRLTFTGWVPGAELPALLRSADVFLNPAYYEPSGERAVQAMACGVPVVVSDVGGHRDVVIDDTTGVLVPPGRPTLLAHRVRQLLDAPVRREALGVAGVDRARSRYSWDRIARETLAAYERPLHAAAA